MIEGLSRAKLSLYRIHAVYCQTVNCVLFFTGHRGKPFIECGIAALPILPVVDYTSGKSSMLHFVDSLLVLSLVLLSMSPIYSCDGAPAVRVGTWHMG